MKTKVEHKNSELVSIKELGWHQIFMNSFEVNPFEVIILLL